MPCVRPFNRRHFLCGLSAAALTAPAAVRAVTHSPRDPVFTHGVASGDPLADRVVLWTRVAPARARAPGAVGRRARCGLQAGRAQRHRVRTAARRLDGQGRRRRPARRPAPALPLQRARAQRQRTHAHAAGGPDGAGALRGVLVLELPGRLLPRLRRGGPGRRARRRDPPRRLHLRVRHRRLRLGGRGRARPPVGPGARDGHAGRLPPPLRASTAATPTCRRCTRRCR